MLTPTDLDAPARLRYRPADLTTPVTEGDWEGSTTFGTLREAIQFAMTEDAPAGQEPMIRAESGLVLDPAMLQGIFDSLQGP
jgi:hypothetical protein